MRRLPRAGKRSEFAGAGMEAAREAGAPLGLAVDGGDEFAADDAACGIPVCGGGAHEGPGAAIRAASPFADSVDGRNPRSWRFHSKSGTVVGARGLSM